MLDRHPERRLAREALVTDGLRTRRRDEHQHEPRQHADDTHEGSR
jgi:hypothetical protein